jgi:hypothetical protein
MAVRQFTARVSPFVKHERGIAYKMIQIIGFGRSRYPLRLETVKASTISTNAAAEWFVMI